MDTYSLKLSVEDCGQTVADEDMVIIDSLSSAPYTMVPSPTSYDLPFSHNTSMTDDEQTDRQTRTISSIVT